MLYYTDELFVDGLDDTPQIYGTFKDYIEQISVERREAHFPNFAAQIYVLIKDNEDWHTIIASGGPLMVNVFIVRWRNSAVSQLLVRHCLSAM